MNPPAVLPAGARSYAADAADKVRGAGGIFQMEGRKRKLVPPALAINRDRGSKPRLPGARSEPYVRFSRIRLSGRWSYLREEQQAAAWAAFRLNNPCPAKKAFGQR